MAGTKQHQPFDLWTTEQLLAVYEKAFGQLEPRARRRIVEMARTNGWDRSWDDLDLLAA
ncbi:MAG TPA: hypothetical protein VGU22_18340 [Methylomirabilota bacterium]|jgi:hypothetical protein|nr:hypothetical protein [Methylomirabilota bacterium]